MKNYVTFGIMMSLASGGRYSAPTLAEKYETSVKTIYRAIDILLSAGMPIKCIQGKGGGYELMPECRINSSFFTIKELSSFISFIKSNKNLSVENYSLEDRLSSINSKQLSAELLEKSQQVVVDTEVWGSKSKITNQMDVIHKSINDCKKLEISYQSLNVVTKRIIHPYCLVFKLGVWYTYAYCEKRKAFRLFKISKINNINVINEKFDKKEIDTLSKPWNKEFENNLKQTKIVLECTKTKLADIYEWLGENIKVEQTDNYFYRVEGEAINSFGLIHRLMQFGNEIKVIYPENIIQNLKNECDKISCYYK